MIKTQNSKLLQSLTFKQLDGSQMHSYATIVDMGFMWRMCFPSAEDREKAILHGRTIQQKYFHLS